MAGKQAADSSVESWYSPPGQVRSSSGKPYISSITNKDQQADEVCQRQGSLHPFEGGADWHECHHVEGNMQEASMDECRCDQPVHCTPILSQSGATATGHASNVV